jgi:KipI family sensor histidine kinase inhibitor
VRCIPASDASLLVELAPVPSAEATRRVVTMHRAIQAGRAPFIVDVHPAYTSILIEFDLVTVDHARVERFVRRLPIDDDASPTPPRVRVVPVCYDGPDGPDLDDVAAHAGLSRDEVIRRHCAAEYTVAFLGFLPGFAYLLGLDAALATPRRPAPRPHVAAGSVAIGGAQTAVYPADGPGGWQIIGRTSLSLAPGWAEPGDVVRFVDASDAGQP